MFALTASPPKGYYYSVSKYIDLERTKAKNAQKVVHRNAMSCVAACVCGRARTGGGVLLGGSRASLPGSAANACLYARG
ncbi:hypothetical protein SDC9_125318 [bioreactor metagenome]|uniref:Uncharacterized protein n=1 Tax=bioreactor metagenome TaxID=1076179 RepID=A0A645CN12_9ZZZZ